MKLILIVILFFAMATATFAAEGDLDSTFDGDGIVATDNNGSNGEEIRDIAIQPDAKIVALGYSPLESTSTFRTVIVRYNANGTIDSTFGVSGKVIIEQLVNPQALVVQPDGKIVLVGSSAFFPNNDFYVARLNADGSFDTTFNGTGTVILDFGGVDAAESVRIQPDGKIVVGGQSGNAIQNNYVIVRFNVDGSLDTSFDSDGRVSIRVAPFSELENFADLIIQPDGKIVSVGTARTRNSNDLSTDSFVTVRFNPDGSLDTTFDGDGIAIAQIGGNTLSVKSVGLQSDGKIIVGGESLVRYNPDGSIDTSFGTNGKVSTAAGTDIEIQSDNKIVLALKNGGVARFNADGSPDLTFSDDGQNIIQPISKSIIVAANASAIQPGGKIVIGGYIGPNDGRDFLLARFETASCTYSLSPVSINSSSAGGAFNFTVSTQQGCSDTVRSNDSFITINTRAIAENSEVIFLSINYSVAANTGSARSGTISIGNQNFTVIQAGIKSRKRVRFF